MIADLSSCGAAAAPNTQDHTVPDKYLDVIRLFVKPDQRCDGEILYRVYEHLRVKPAFWTDQVWFFFGDRDPQSTIDTFTTTYHAWKQELSTHPNLHDFCFAMTERFYQRLFFAHIVSGITEFDMGIIFRLANDINQRKSRILMYSYKPVNPTPDQMPMDASFVREQRVKHFLP